MKKGAFIVGLATLLALVLVCFCSQAQAGFIQDSIDDGSLVLYHDYRAGHTQDLSGQGNHGTNTGYWATDGLQFGATDEVTVTDGGAATELQLTEGTIVVLGHWARQTTQARFVVKRDGGGTNYTFKVHDAEKIALFDGTNSRIVSCDITDKKYLAINFKNGETGEGFADGVSLGSLNGSHAIAVNDANLIIGNYFAGGYPADNTISAVLIFNDRLTATEHAKLYAELTSLKWPSKAAGTAQGTYGAELVVDGNMETAGTAAWTAGASATLTKEDNRVLGGEQVLRVARNGVDYPYAKQNILTIGKEYRATGWARGDGTCSPGITTESSYVKLWQGSTSTTWQPFDVTFTSTGTGFRCQNFTTVAGWAEFDNVTVTEVDADWTQFKSDWNVKEQANVPPNNYFIDSPFTVNSGAFKVEVQTVNSQDSKVMECTNSGIAYVLSENFQGDFTQDAYGTWSLWFYKEDADTMAIGFVMNQAGTLGYFVNLAADESVALVELPAMGVLFSTTASKFTPDAWHKITFTRQQSDGQMTVYLDGVLVDPTGGSGTNPVVDNTVTTSQVLTLDTDAGSKYSFGTKDGNYIFIKKHGVQ